MKYYIKSAKGYWLAQGNGYTQNQSEAYAFTRPNVAVCFQSDGCTPSDSPKHSQGVLTTLCFAKLLVAIKL